MNPQTPPPPTGEPVEPVTPEPDLQTDDEPRVDAPAEPTEPPAEPAEPEPQEPEAA